MQHNFYIFCGSPLLPLANRTVEMMHFNSAETIDYFHCAVTGTEGISTLEMQEKQGGGFFTDERSEYDLKQGSVTAFDTAKLSIGTWVSKYFNIENSRDTTMIFTLVVPLWDKDAAEQAKKMIEAIKVVSSDKRIDIVALSPTLTSAETPAEEVMAESKNTLEEMKGWGDVHRLIVLSNRNSTGMPLMLESVESQARILTDYATLCIENYSSIYPLSEDYDKVEACTFGLSECYFDVSYFTEYMLHQCYLKLMRREKIHEDKIDVNKTAKEVAKNFTGSSTKVSRFLAEEVNPKVRKEETEDHNIVVECTPGVDKSMDELKDRLESCIAKEDISLPQKQAMLSMTLGRDDDLLTNYLFPEEQQTFDDCYTEPLNIFIDENNKLPGAERDEEGNEKSVSKRVLGDGESTIVNPLPELKSLRADIMRDNNYLRMKRDELNGLEKKKSSSSVSNTDEDVKIQEIKEALDKKEQEYGEKQDRYRTLREEYESLVQEIADITKRRKILDESTIDYKDIIEKMEKGIEKFREERIERINFFKKDLMKKGLWMVGLIVLLVLVNAGCWYGIKDWAHNDLMGWLLGALGVVVLITIGMWFYGRLELKHFIEELDAELEKKEEKLRKRKMMLKELPTRLQITGTFMDKLYKINESLSRKQEKIVDYVRRLKKWYKEEKATCEAYEDPVSSGMFKPVIKNGELDTYVDRKINNLLDGTNLHKYVERDDITYDQFLCELRKKLTQNILEVIKDFSLYDYLSGKKNYTFLPDRTVALNNLLSDMGRSSAVFLQAKENITSINSEALFVSLCTSVEERQQWEKECREYFSKTPTTLVSASPYRLLVFRRIHTAVSDIIL